ncbi:MAG: hypothetical protein OEM49_09985 [Myxococcales bacterium]|nr:hypothetical protein [Myxococcales bacterium]MDH5308216.1 hypothetical protein [Myxococcales bacterium]
MTRNGSRLMRKSIAVFSCALAILVMAAPIAADEYDPQDAGHPLRILAYGLHPVGVMLDLLIFRPAHWIGSYKPIALFFGHEPYTR